MGVSSEPGFLWRLEGRASHAFALLLALLATLDFPWLVMAYIIAPLLSKVSPCLSGLVNYVLLFYKCGTSD